MKSVIFVALWVVVGACGGGVSHDVTACKHPIGAVSQCESVCNDNEFTKPLSGSACQASSIDGDAFSCPNTTEIDGDRGCCGAVGGGSDVVVRFYQCN